MSVFDPLGFLTPFTIQARILMQDVWSSGIKWDEKLLNDESYRCFEWLKDLESGKSCKIPRCYQYLNSNLKSAELHIFCDASKKAYTAVGYWRFCLVNNSFHTH